MDRIVDNCQIFEDRTFKDLKSSEPVWEFCGKEYIGIPEDVLFVSQIGDNFIQLKSLTKKDKIVFICGDDLNKNLIKLEDSIFCTKHLFRHLWQKGKGLYFYPPKSTYYRLISEDFKFHDMDTDGRYKWRNGLILYEAMYDCPDGPFFSRTPEDFYSNFIKVFND